LASPWAFFVVLGLAVGLRGWKLADWSLWEDEEGTVFFSQRPDMAFARAFPIFFRALGSVYEFTGVSVAAGRIFSASIAVFGLILVYACFQGFVTRRAALLASVLLAINLGHVFWSQSIRYYNLLVVFQLLAMYGFLVGFEEKRYWALLLSNVAFALAMLTHFSAVLLMPVFVGYLILMAWRRETAGAYGLKGYLIFGLPLLAILAAFAIYLVEMQRMLGGMVIPSARNPIHVFVTVAAYFGLPLLGLGLLTPFVPPRTVPPRILLFFLIAGVVPVLELLVISGLKIINVTWYYALFALPAFAVLAAFTLLGLYERGWRRLAVGSGAAAALSSAVLLAGYYTTMHGDRPRWNEAAQVVKLSADIQINGSHNPAIFATVPGVVAYYLGIEADQTMGHPLVQLLPEQLPEQEVLGERWYLVEAGHVSREYESWLERNCDVVARFEARTGPVDRTVSVYHHAAHRVQAAPTK
jgi:hypothetical protein